MITCVARDRLSVQTDERIDGLYFLPRVGKFGGVIYKFWYIGGHIARPWINHRGKVSFSIFLLFIIFFNICLILTVIFLKKNYLSNNHIFKYLSYLYNHIFQKNA
jgi:hypothetical protein